MVFASRPSSIRSRHDWPRDPRVVSAARAPAARVSVIRRASGRRRAIRRRPIDALKGPGVPKLEPLEERWLLAAWQPGDVFVARDSGKVEHRDPTGSIIEVLDSHSSLGAADHTRGMAFDEERGLYLTNFFGASVSKFDASLDFLGNFGSGYSGEPESILFDAYGDALVGAASIEPGDPSVNAGQPFDNRIRKFDAHGLPLAQYAVAVENRGVDWIDLAADQHTLYYTSEGHHILRFDTAAGAQLADFNAEPLPGSVARALRLLPSGGLLVADSEAIERLDAEGNVVQSYDVAAADSWFALDLDPDGTSFWSADAASGEVVKFDIDSGAELAHFHVAGQIFGLAIADEITAASNRLTVTDVSHSEGNAGTTSYVFTVSLAHVVDEPVLVRYSTVDRSAAIADGDYQGAQGTLTFLPGSLSLNVTVLAQGDLKSENDEQFQLLLSDPFASNTDLAVAATSNLYRAAGSQSQTSGTLPAEIDLSPDGPGSLTFPTVGVQSPFTAGTAWPALSSADGGTDQFGTPRGTNITASDGLSGVIADRYLFLAGVFVSDAEPVEGAEPPTLDFRPIGTSPQALGTQFTRLAARLNQVFYIGDGWTDTGALQHFDIPQGATRLLLGFVDGEFFGSDAPAPPGFYDDNTGQVRIGQPQADGIGTIVDDPDPLPRLSIDSTSGHEPSFGPTPFVFHVTLEEPSGRIVTVAYHTQDDTASASSGDYQPAAGTLTFLPNHPLTQNVTVLVNSDSNDELDESFDVVLSAPVNATLDQATGIGTILEDGLLSLDLLNADDTGVSQSDNITAVARPRIVVNVARAGHVTMDFDDAGVAQALGDASPGTPLTLQPSAALADGAHTIRATLEVPGSNAVTRTLMIVVDTRGPKLLGASGAGTAIRFDGVDDLVAIPDSPAFDAIENGDALTIEAWVRVDAWYDGWFSIVNKYEANTDLGWTFQINETGGMEFNTGDGASSGFVPALHQWNHLAVAYDRSEGVIRFFVNGQQISQSAFSSDIPDTSGESFYLSFNPFGGDEFSNGAIDELQLWDRARSQAEIAADMSRPLTGNESGLVGYWPFNEAGGDVAHDLSGHHLDGLLGAGDPSKSPSWVDSGAKWPATDTLRAPISSREWVFSEPIASNFANADQFAMTGPAGRTREINEIDGGNTSFTLRFDRTFTPGEYNIAGPLTITDLAGNPIDQDQDGVGGEIGDDVPVDKFILLPAIPHTVSISNVASNEGNSGTTPFVFTLTLSSASNLPIDVAYTTKDGTATAADADYVPTSGVVTFAPGTTTQRVTVLVNGDIVPEPAETFSIVLTDDQEGTLTQKPGGGVGTILNDDFFPPLHPEPPINPQPQPPQPPPPQPPPIDLAPLPVVFPPAIPLQISIAVVLNFMPPVEPKSQPPSNDFMTMPGSSRSRQEIDLREREVALLSYLADDDHAKLLGVEPGDEIPAPAPKSPAAFSQSGRVEIEANKPLEEVAVGEASSFRLWWLAVAPGVLFGGKLLWNYFQKHRSRRAGLAGTGFPEL
jgi:hypothetical protein